MGLYIGQESLPSLPNPTVSDLPRTEILLSSWRPCALDSILERKFQVVFLRPSSDVAVTLDLLRTLKSTVSMVSVLSDEHSPLESTQMALLEGT